MNISEKLFLLIVTIFFLVSCDKEDITSRQYPRITTLDVSNITNNGATFNAKILYRGDFEIKKYGFVWAETENPEIESSEKIVYGKNIQSETFSVDVFTTLKEGVNYYVRPFIQTSDYTVYGSEVLFKSLGSKAPQIATIFPLIGTIGDTITISGQGFSYLNSTNQVFFNDIPSTIVVTSDTLIKSIVPDLSELEYNISVSIIGNVETFKQGFKVSMPLIESYYPNTVAIDDTLTILGSNFSLKYESNILTINDIQCNIVFSDKNVLKAITPPGIQILNTIELKIAEQKISAQGQLSFLEPIIISVMPTAASFKDTITITGENFSFLNASNLIFIDGTKAEIVYSSKNKVQFTIPEDITKSKNPIQYNLAGRILNYNFIQVLPPIIHAINPSYISIYENGNFELTGENFNSIINKNSVFINGIKTNIVNCTKNKMVLNFPRDLIPDIEVSVIDTVEISVKVLDQDTSLTGGLILNYKSRWTRKRDFPGAPRIYASQFTSNGKLYVGLGESGWKDTEPFFEYYSDLWEFDPQSNKWSQKTSLPAAGRFRALTLAFDTKIYIIGGSSSNSTSIKNEVWEYDASIDHWSRKNDFPGDDCSSGFAIAGKGYVGGGNYETLEFWEYNPSSDSWTQKNESPILSFTSALGGKFNDYGFVFTNYYNKLWIYNHEIDEWNVETTYDADGIDMAPFVIDNKVYLGLNPSTNFSGGTRLYMYDRNSDNWQTIIFKGKERRDATSLSLFDKGYILLGRYNSHAANLIDVWEFDPLKPN